MSQQKVDQYKKERYNRKNQLKKEKRNRLISRIAGGVIVVAVAGWIGFSAYSRMQAGKPVSYTEVSMDALNNYMSTLN